MYVRSACLVCTSCATSVQLLCLSDEKEEKKRKDRRSVGPIGKNKYKGGLSHTRGHAA